MKTEICAHLLEEEYFWRWNFKCVKKENNKGYEYNSRRNVNDLNIFSDVFNDDFNDDYL